MRVVVVRALCRSSTRRPWIHPLHPVTTTKNEDGHRRTGDCTAALIHFLSTPNEYSWCRFPPEILRCSVSCSCPRYTSLSHSSIRPHPSLRATELRSYYPPTFLPVFVPWSTSLSLLYYIMRCEIWYGEKALHLHVLAYSSTPSSGAFCILYLPFFSTFRITSYIFGQSTCFACRLSEWQKTSGPIGKRRILTERTDGR